MNAIEPEATAQERLLSELKRAMQAAEDFVATALHNPGESATLQQLESALGEARAKLQRAEQALVARTKRAATVTDDYVHDHPWKSVAIGGALGVIVGLLIGRR
jgi:ElaB/YqjD/DUF883 family membrane-anchored ribosome-binding protein